LINPKLRKSYDLRGTVGETLGEDDAYGVGVAFAAMARRRGFSRIAVSRDGRTSSPALEAALIDGLLRGGCQVFRLPLGPTPLVSFAIHRLGLEGGVMVTGSHNPPDQNGFKLQLGGGPVYGEGLKALWEDSFPRGPFAGAAEAIDLSDEYVAALAAEVAAPVSAVWDSGNGATGAIVERLIARLPGRHEALFTAIDGTFPNHHPDPSVPENLLLLRNAVVAGAHELGIAFDGDGDRVGLVDGEGEIVWADQLLLLLARDVLAEHPGSAIVADVTPASPARAAGR
jgi:phosphomannomutase